MLKKSFFIAVIAMGLTVLSPAPINGYKLGVPVPQRPVDTEQSLEAQQNNAKQMGTVGSVPMDTNETQTQDVETDPTASSNLAAASDMSANKQSDIAAKNIETAAQVKPETGGFSWLMGLIIIGVVAGGLFGFKKWADQAVPYPK